MSRRQGAWRFARQHGALIGCIPLIRAISFAAGGVQFVRLEINLTARNKRLLPIAGNS